MKSPDPDNEKSNTKSAKRFTPLITPSWKKLHRSKEKITHEDLKILQKLALDDYKELSKKHTKYNKIKKNRLAIVLAQGAALHYCDDKTGIRDFDVYSFYKKSPVRYPFRRRVVKDFGNDKFGTSYLNHSKPSTKEKYKDFKGRLVDIMGRDLDYNKGETYVKTIHNYLETPQSLTPFFLSEKAMVVLWPEKDLGKIIWNKKSI